MFSLEALRTLNIGDLKSQDSVVSGSVSLSFRSVRSLIVHVMLLSLASIFFALWICSIQTTCALDPLLTYSPVNEAVQYLEKKFDGRLDSTSIFRGLGPVIDAAWGQAGLEASATRLTREQFLLAGGSDNTAAIQYLPEDGGGYMAQVDGYHQLHCVDLLRRYIRRDYYASFDAAFNSALRPHLGHCVEIIRQKLMCTADLTMVSYNWVSGVDDPHPNLSTWHQCVDYNRILEWSAQHDARVPKGHVVKFGDATELPENPV